MQGTRPISMPLLTALAAYREPGAREGARNVGILVFDDLFLTEFVAPFDVYKHVGGRMNVVLIGRTRYPIITYEGAIIHPHFGFADAPRVDVLVVPSGNRSQGVDLKNRELLAYVKKAAAEAEYVTAHCWGAYTLAECGLLDGKRATTFPSSLDDLARKYPAIEVVMDRRYVEDGKFITSCGGVAAFEAALAVVERLYGRVEAENAAKGLVFAPQNLDYASDAALSAARS